MGTHSTAPSTSRPGGFNISSLSSSSNPLYASNPLHPSNPNENSREEDEHDLESVVPPHFYGELAKTDLGCRVLVDSGHVAEFAMFIRQHGLESEDVDLILKLKSVLWAVVSCFDFKFEYSSIDGVWNRVM